MREDRRTMPILPSEDQFAELAAIAGSEADRAKVMLNLNRYRERAQYGDGVPDGLDPDVSGREAYLRYGGVAARVLSRLGGRILWEAESERIAVGEEGDRYDEVLAVWYPSVAAFIQLATDPELLAAHPHRAAGLERAVLLCCESGPEPVLEANLPSP
jgi:uncharacterized protein (DUF1330 family)